MSRVVLCENAIDRIDDEVAALGCERVLVVCGGNVARTGLLKRVVERLGPRRAATFDRVVEHSGTALVTEGAARARELGIDGLVAVGGGSASDTAKGIAILLAEGGRIEDHASTFEPPDTFHPAPLHRPKLPVVAVPTTASAAEVTPGLGIKDEAGRKLLFWDVKLASRLIILDPLANLEVPVPIMASTAMNAFAHCVEGLYSRGRNAISEGLAYQGIRMLSRAIPAMVADSERVEHRAAVLAGANISGMVISNARVGIHHAICHSLGAVGGLSHGVANAVILPYAAAYNVEVAARELRTVAEAMGQEVRGLSDADGARLAIDAIADLQAKAEVPRRLRDTDLARDLIPRIAEYTMGDRGLYFNPRSTTSVDQVIGVLETAW